MKKVFLFCLLLAAPLFSASVSDNNVGYSMTLPANWQQIKTKPLQHYFRDSTKQYPSAISIVRYTIDKATYPTPHDWTQAQFIAYQLSVENSVFPFGAIMYFDSSSTTKLGSDWAPEAFSVLYPGDGSPTYCEFIRYVAQGDYGYEIYAIGDSTDMTNHVDFYASIIASTQLTVPVVSLFPFQHETLGQEQAINDFDLLGRKLIRRLSNGTHRESNFIANQMTIQRPRTN